MHACWGLNSEDTSLNPGTMRPAGWLDLEQQRVKTINISCVELMFWILLFVYLSGFPSVHSFATRVCCFSCSATDFAADSHGHQDPRMQNAFLPGGRVTAGHSAERYAAVSEPR